jgi:hypothetical protein
MKRLSELCDWDQLWAAAPPSADYLAKRAALKAGDKVKIGRNHEHFWVEVEAVAGDELHGSVLNDLICEGNEGIGRGDMIAFDRRNVGQIDPGGDWNFQQHATDGLYELFKEIIEEHPGRSREAVVAALHQGVDDAVAVYDGEQVLSREWDERLARNRPKAEDTTWPAPSA